MEWRKTIHQHSGFNSTVCSSAVTPGPNLIPLGHPVCLPASCFSLLTFHLPHGFICLRTPFFMAFLLCIFVLLCFFVTLASGFSVNISVTLSQVEQMIGLVQPLTESFISGHLTSRAHGQSLVVCLWVRHQALDQSAETRDLLQSHCTNDGNFV